MRPAHITALVLLAASLQAQALPRSHAATNAFRRAVPCPALEHTGKRCPGYVIDHVVPLCAGGADAPRNMQWQTVADGKVKDAIERSMCAHRRM